MLKQGVLKCDLYDSFELQDISDKLGGFFSRAEFEEEMEPVLAKAKILDKGAIWRQTNFDCCEEVLWECEGWVMNDEWADKYLEIEREEIK